LRTEGGPGWRFFQTPVNARGWARADQPRATEAGPALAELAEGEPGGTPRSLPRSWAHGVYRISAEALQNVRTHAQGD